MYEVRPVIKHELERAAAACVDAMGDVFWDFTPLRDEPQGFADPRHLAESAVNTALAQVAARLDPFPTYSTDLEAEYRGIVTDTEPSVQADAVLQRALVQSAEWTPEGAATIVRLAREHGVFVLRNALALAAAMGIEDGERGR